VHNSRSVYSQGLEMKVGFTEMGLAPRKKTEDTFTEKVILGSSLSRVGQECFKTDVLFFMHTPHFSGLSQ